MVDNRSAGFFGIGGSFNFKSGDISGTAAKTQDDKMGRVASILRNKKEKMKKIYLIVKNTPTGVLFYVQR